MGVIKAMDQLRKVGAFVLAMCGFHVSIAGIYY